MTATPAPGAAGEHPDANAAPEGEEPPHRQHAEADPRGKRLLVLSLTALGVVYGDIGTSPLYSIQEAFKPAYGLTPNVQNVYGLLSRSSGRWCSSSASSTSASFFGRTTAARAVYSRCWR